LPVPFGVAANKPLAGKYGIKGFPTIKLFVGTSDKPKDYNGERTAKAMYVACSGSVCAALPACSGALNEWLSLRWSYQFGMGTCTDSITR
jgi:hypothetical protein